MNKVIINVGTMTYAIKLRKRLHRAGIESRYVKSLGNDGCLHGVEIAQKDLYSAVAILKENTIDYSVKIDK